MSTRIASFVKGVAALEQLPRARIPEVAVAGRSNVGKSSLLNVLFARKGLAKVSSTPGKTREINFFSIDGRFHLVDLPGYGYARAPSAAKKQWDRLVEEYLQSREQLAGIVQLVDARHGVTPSDRRMLKWIGSSGTSMLLLATKSDKLKRGALAESIRGITAEVVGAGVPIVTFSAVTRAGKRETLAWIDHAVKQWQEAHAA